MSDTIKKLRASLAFDAINGDSFERSVFRKQVVEAVDELARVTAQRDQLLSDVEHEKQKYSELFSAYHEVCASKAQDSAKCDQLLKASRGKV